MRTLEGDRGLFDMVGEVIANQLAVPSVETPPPVEPKALKAVSRGLIEAIRTAEDCQQAADRDDAKGFVTEYGRLHAVLLSISAIWDQVAEHFAATKLWRPSNNGLHYRSLHHVLWAEARTLHDAVALLACSDDSGAMPDKADPDADKLFASWGPIRRAILESDIHETGTVEVRLADELSAALQTIETPVESDDDSELPVGLPDAWESLRASDRLIVSGAVQLHDGGLIDLTVTAIGIKIDRSPSTVSHRTKELIDAGWLVKEGKSDFRVPRERRAIARQSAAKLQ